MNLSAIKDFDRFNQYAIVHHSSNIEGSTLTLTETELLLAEGITPKGKPLAHSQMEQDHYKALLFILDLAQQNQPLLIADLQKINALVMKNTGSVLNTALGTTDATIGDFRKVNVRAGDTYFINYDKVIPYTSKLVSVLNESFLKEQTLLERLELSFKAHFDLVTIHPFLDGNGRTSRLLMNYIQAKYKLPLSMVFKENRVEYIQALKDARANEDLSVFMNFMQNQYQQQLSQEIANAQSIKNESHQKGKGFSLVF